MAFGSDFPRESPEPLRGLHAARTRQSGQVDDSGKPLAPEPRLDGAAALGGYTSGAAFAAFQEDRRGRLAPGFFCDVTVLTVDPVTCEPADLLQAKVLLTMINGVVVHRAR
jgi:predicted amidohydrolase YtcJ